MFSLFQYYFVKWLGHCDYSASKSPWLLLEETKINYESDPCNDPAPGLLGTSHSGVALVLRIVLGNICFHLYNNPLDIKQLFLSNIK